MGVNELRKCLLAFEGLGREAAASPPPPPRAAEQDCDRAVLELAGETVSVPLNRIDALLRSPQVVPVPGAAAGLIGAVRHGSRMLAVVDPGRALERGDSVEPRVTDTLLVLRLDDSIVAIPVDGVHGLVDRDGADPARELDLDVLARQL